MRIVNAMFGRKKGGIEQAFADYSSALIAEKNEVLSLAQPSAAILPQLASRNIVPVTLKNYGQWDMLAVYRLSKILHQFKPDIIITHGNRATILLRKAAKGAIPVVGVCHNYSLKHLLGCSALLTITDHLRQTVIEKGQAEASVFTIPNMIELPLFPPFRATWRNPPVIGTMGRFVAKKGFDIFIQALALLKAENIPFQAILGGSGEEEVALKKLAAEAGLGEQLRFTGWVDNKDAFYQSCDIFCLPSLHEPFGIVLLEALLQQLPVVTTKSEGPREIVQHEKDALLVEIGDARALALALSRLLATPQMAKNLAEEGYKTVTSSYDIKKVGKKLHLALERVLKG